MDNNININNQNNEWFESPLLYFENLVYYKHFNFLKSNFAHVSESEYDSFGTYYDESIEAKVTFYQNSETGESDEVVERFSDYIAEIVVREGLNSLKKTNEITLNLRDKGIKKEFLKSIISDISFLLKVLSNFEEANKNVVIEKRLKSIENHLQVRHRRLLGTNEIQLEKDSNFDDSAILRNKQEIENLVESNKIEEALNKLKLYFYNNSECRDDCMLYLSRLSSEESSFKKTRKRDKVELNELRKNVIDLIKKMN